MVTWKSFNTIAEKEISSMSNPEKEKVGLTKTAPVSRLATPPAMLLNPPLPWSSSIFACYKDIGVCKQPTLQKPYIHLHSQVYKWCKTVANKEHVLNCINRDMFLSFRGWFRTGWIFIRAGCRSLDIDVPGSNVWHACQRRRQQARYYGNQISSSVI